MGAVALQVNSPFAADGAPLRVLRDAGAAGPGRFLNREVAWIDFAERILDLAADEREPLLERVKFVSICANGADEFFQVRVAGLKDQAAANVRQRSADGLSAREQLALIRTRYQALLDRQGRIFAGLLPGLAAAGVRLVDYARLDPDAREQLRAIFERDIYPVLTPLAVDPGHPFPYISNLSLNLAVIVEDPESGQRRFARVKVPPLLPRFVRVPDDDRHVPLEQVIAHNLDQLFPEMRIGAHHAFRVTRNADIEFDDEDADDLLEAVELELRRRRFGRAVRLEVERGVDQEVLDFLSRELELEPDDVYLADAPHDLGALWIFTAIDRPDLAAPRWSPVLPPRLAGGGDEPVDMFETLRKGDLLVHHPYDSFSRTVEAFLEQAAADPDVLAIKQTLYRTSGDAGIVKALAAAAESGKQVAVLVELMARFDEQRNIVWARQLEQAGVHVVYGVVGLKTHTKTTLVVRREEDGVRRYCHVGTGNYNADTARVYEDLGLLSADPDLGADLTDLFNHLTGFSRPSRARSLIVAPDRFRSWFLEEVAKERAAGPTGRIVLKCNGLTDPEIIDALYAASQAGVHIECIVRSLCSLRPGIPGLSQTITVRSIVGRFLEHSRIYRFGEPDDVVRAHQSAGEVLRGAQPARGEASARAAGVGSGADVLEGGEIASHAPLSKGANAARWFIGSGDLMERNLDRRIEALVRVREPELCAHLEDVLELARADDTNAWALSGDGTWARVPRALGISLQDGLCNLALWRRKRASEAHARAEGDLGRG